MPNQNQAPDTDIIEDAVYQINTQNRPIRRYVRAVRVYGDKDIVDCEIIHDLDSSTIGEVIPCSREILVTPDQYPKFQFNPNTWISKVRQTPVQKQQEIGAFIDAHIQALSVTASDVLGDENVARTIDTLKALLLPWFGGFTLALFLNFVKSKIAKSLESKQAKPQPKSFQQKVSELNRIWAKRSAEENMKFAHDSIKSKKPKDTGDDK